MSGKVKSLRASQDARCALRHLERQIPASPEQGGGTAVLMFRSSNACAAAVAAFMALSASAVAQEAGSTLPGGASSLQETYQDWSLSCQSTPKVVCAITQQQTQQNGQRVLAIELRNAAEGAVSGNLVLPFGLLLDAGVTLQIDDGPAREPLRFSTCLPAGCIVPLDFNAKTMTTLRTGTTLAIKAKGIDQKDVALSVSLKGVAAALDRLKVLTGA
jgi:invasion protein IalB